VDGDVSTAWRVGAFSNPEGARWRLDLEAPVTVDHLTLVQPQSPTDNRYLAAISVRFDDGPWQPFALTEQSRAPEGEELRFARRSVRRVEVRVDGTNVGRRPVYDGLSSVGIAELRIGDVVADEVVRVPRDVLSDASTTAGRPLWFSLTRSRSDPAVAVRSDEEPTLKRVLSLPAPRSFGFAASVRLSALAPDDRLDEILGTAGSVRATSSGRLPGDVRARASAAIDGDPATAWSPGFLEQRGHWIEVTAPRATSVDHLDLQLVADGRHSVPTRLRLTNEHGEVRDVEVPPVPQGGGGNVVPRTVSFAPLLATALRVTVTDVAEDLTRDYFSTQLVSSPIGIAELGIPGMRRDATAETLPDVCRPGLLDLDGRAVAVRLVGTRADAEARRAVRAVPCDDGVATDLAAGDHEVRSAPGTTTGLDVDRVVLASSASGAAVAPTGPAAGGDAAAAPSVPHLEVKATSRSSFRIVASGATEPFWLVLGQSRNRGWDAEVDGRALPPSTLVDGFANGWRIDPARGPMTIDLTWGPQRIVDASLAASALGALLCLALVALSFRGRRRHEVVVDSVVDEPALGLPDGGLPSPRWRLALRLVAFAVAAALVVPPLHALLVTALGAVLLVVPARFRSVGRAVTVVGAAAAIAAGGLYTALLQHRYRYPAGFHWPREFSVAHHLAWAGILLLAVEVALGRSPGRAVPAAPDPAQDPGEGPEA
jgi:hypothetical protein